MAERPRHPPRQRTPAHASAIHGRNATPRHRNPAQSATHHGRHGDTRLRTADRSPAWQARHERPERAKRVHGRQGHARPPSTGAARLATHGSALPGTGSVDGYGTAGTVGMTARRTAINGTAGMGWRLWLVGSGMAGSAWPERPGLNGMAGMGGNDGQGMARIGGPWQAWGAWPYSFWRGRHGVFRPYWAWLLSADLAWPALDCPGLAKRARQESQGLVFLPMEGMAGLVRRGWLIGARTGRHRSMGKDHTVPNGKAGKAGTGPSSSVAERSVTARQVRHTIHDQAVAGRRLKARKHNRNHLP